MRLQITSSGVTIDEKLHDYIEEKLGIHLEKYLKHFPEESKVANVKVERGSRFGFRVSFDMHLPGKHIFSEETGRDLYATVVALREELEHQIKNYKEKLIETKK